MKNLIIILLSLFSQSVLADGSALAPLFTINSNGDVNLGPKKEPREFDAYKESYVEVHHIEMEITRNIKDTPPPPQGNAVIQEKHITKESAERAVNNSRLERPDSTFQKKEKQNDLHNAYRTKEKKTYFERFDSLNQAKTTFDKNQENLSSRIKDKNKKLTQEGDQLIQIINEVAKKHNTDVKNLLLSSIGDINEVAASLKKKFKTPKESQFGEELYKTSHYIEIAEKYGDGKYINKAELITLAENALKLADEALLEGNTDEAAIYIEISKALADLALGMTPGIGWAKDVYEASLGKSLVTGKDLDASDRVFATLGVASAGTLSKTKTILNAIKKLSNGDKSFIAIALNIRKLTNGIVSPITFRHIVFGNFKHTTDTGKYIITGGLHTKAGLDQFLNLNKGIGHNYNIIEVLNFTNPTIQTGADILQKTYNNGVIALQLPRTAFNAKSYNSVDGFKGVKTLWPDNFSIEDYVNALKQALESETGISAIARSKSTPDLPIEIKEVYLKNSNKINYVVRIKKGELETFYPELNQQ